MKFTKGHNSVKIIGGVVVLVMSYNALYLYQFLKKYLISFQLQT